MSQIEKRASASIFAPNHLEFLTDGVFAIVMTLLVLEITIPEIAYPSVQAELPRKLLELWPKLYNYALSFLVLGVFWGFHHLAFHSIKRANMALVWLNIVFLMFVALTPFSTSIQERPGPRAEQIPFVIYLLNMILAAAMIFIIWTYATGKHRLVDSDISPRLVKVYKLIYLGFSFSLYCSLVFLSSALTLPLCQWGLRW